jgi:hypothetical protein
MSNINYDINYGAIPPVTIPIDSAQQSKIMADIVTLNSTMYSGSSTIPYTFTTDNTNITNYNAFTHNVGIGSTGTVVNIDADGLTMKKGADIKIGGKSLCEAIEKIEERLGILKPNTELESRWDKLKELRQQYVEMERDLLEKEKLMKILKET